MESLYLNGNWLKEIPVCAFKGNPQLNFLALQNNRIKRIAGVKELPALEFLDLSHNLIEEVDAKQELPKSLVFLKLVDNPVVSNSPSLSAYRKPIVRALPDLVELDKIEIVVAERLAYDGLLPKCNRERLLKEKTDSKR